MVFCRSIPVSMCVCVCRNCHKTLLFKSFCVLAYINFSSIILSINNDIFHDFYYNLDLLLLQYSLVLAGIVANKRHYSFYLP